MQVYRAIVSEYNDAEAQDAVEMDWAALFLDDDPAEPQALPMGDLGDLLFEVANTWTVGADVDACASPVALPARPTLPTRYYT